MNTFELFALAIVLWTAQFLVASGSIWLGAKIADVSEMSFVRAMATTGIIAFLMLILLPIMLWFNVNATSHFIGRSIIDMLVELVIIIAFQLGFFMAMIK
ncbi:MAG TPA: hypothetical protein VGI75_14790, partial [Pirellulales bacterium]